MADSTDLSQTVTDAAQTPAATTVDGMQTQFRALKDLDDVNRRRQSDCAGGRCRTVRSPAVLIPTD